MSNTENENTPPVNDNDPGSNPSEGGKPEQGTLEWYKAEAEKWTALSRKHEDAEKKLRKEVNDLRTASMSDAEKAIEKAKQDGASETLRKVTDRLVKAELKAHAAEKGATLPDLDALNLAKFATEDGDPDEEAIAKFVDSLGTSKNRFPSGKDLGIGRQGGDSRPKQWTRADLQGKTHAEIVEAREKGHLDTILGRDN